MPTQKEIDAAEKAISSIPASGGGVMALYPETLRNKLSNQMISEIAKVALEAAELARAGIRQPEQLGAMDW